MKIKCPQCDTTYDVSSEIANSGAQVQCAKCSDIFTAMPVPDAEIALDPLPEPVPESVPEPVEKEIAETGEEQDLEFLDVATDDPVEETAPEADREPELLSPEEKDFFSSFGSKLAKEEEAASENKEQLAEPEADAPPPDDGQPKNGQDEDDIGWVETQGDAPPAASEPDPFEAIESPADEDLFTDQDQQAKPEPVTQLELPPDPLQTATTDEKLPELTLAQRLITPLNVGWGALAASIVVLIISATTFRVPIVKALPALAGLYEKAGYPVNIRGLEFYALSHQWMNDGGPMHLVVRGEIVNITDEAVPVPEIIFAMIDGTGLEFFQWTERTTEKQLAPSARTRFRARIPAPANRVRQLKIRFAKR